MYRRLAASGGQETVDVEPLSGEAVRKGAHGVHHVVPGIVGVTLAGVYR